MTTSDTPFKHSIALVIKNKKGEFLIVKRPDDEPGALAGVWGFPAVSLKEGENEVQAVHRAARVKLGVEVEIIRKIGEKTADRGEFVLHLSDYEATITSGTPSVPQPDTSMTQYTDYHYANDPAVLFPAAEKDSLCSQIYLQSIGISI